MANAQELSDDLPHVVVLERRRHPDRRGMWRGGRRATDWTKRPLGAWGQLEKHLMPWRQWIEKISLRSGSPRHP